MQALPTVLAPIVRIRKEELSLKYLSTRGDAARRALLRHPARRPGARRRPVPARALSAGRRGARSRAGARCPTPSWRSRSCRCTSTTSRQPTCARCVARTYTEASLRQRRDHAAEAARATACPCRRCPTARRWPSRTWRCSCSASCSSTNWRAAAQTLNILGATSRRHRQRGRVRDARQARHPRLHAVSPHGRMSPFQQAQMFSLQDANIHNLAIDGVFDDCQDIVKAVANDLDVQAPAPHRHRQLDQLGAAAGAGRLLLRRLLPGHRAQRPARRASPCRRATSATSAPATSRA